MDTKVQVQPTALTADLPGADTEHAAQNAPKPDWHVLVVTRIDIKRTKLSPGSSADLTGPAPLG
ncbi:hypothetical protein D4R89_13905 [bacterium]|nr:MAG: hypothetical protein D4R89_13905 [bacterium]